MIKYILSFFIVLLGCTLYGQGGIEKKRNLSEKVFLGGGIGLQFGYVTAVEVLPIVGYRPIDDLYFGLKGKYEYFKHSSYPTGTTIYGGSVFGMYTIFDAMVAYAEYEVLSLESSYFNYPVNMGEDRFLLQSPLIGGGFIQSLGGRSKILLLLLWNIDDSYTSYYSNPIIRVSFLF